MIILIFCFPRENYDMSFVRSETSGILFRQKLICTLCILLILICGQAETRELGSVKESSRRVPVAYNVDVAVIGGSTWAVAAAAAAAKGGASVFLAAPRPYLGEDMCATLRLSPEKGNIPDTELARAVFKSGKAVTPIHIKKTLDNILVKAKVNFLFGCYATDPLIDAKGNICGFVMANRAGRQAVLAKIVIDATDRAWFARMAGVKTGKWVKGKIPFKRSVIMAQGTKKGSKTIEHDVGLALQDGSFRSFAEAEQQARDKTYTDGQLRASESLFHVPPDPVVCMRTAGQWKGGAKPNIGHFLPKGVGRLYVLSGCADIPRKEAERLLKPCGMTGIGALVGKSAAQAAKTLPKPSWVKPMQRKGQQQRRGEGAPYRYTPDRWCIFDYCRRNRYSCSGYI